MKISDSIASCKKHFFTISAICILLLLQSCDSNKRDFYQIMIYSYDNNRQETVLDNFFADAFIPALNRVGVKNVGVFKEIESADSLTKKLYVLIPFKTINQFQELEARLKNDADFQKKGREYIDAEHDNPPYLRIHSILLNAFKSFPNYGIPDHQSNPSDRIYELRSYQASTEKLYQKKVEMFDDGGETKIFVDLGFQPIFFGEVLSGDTMPNLMYLTTHENDSSHAKNWNSFRNSPEWEKLKADKQYANTVSEIEKYYLYPTDYSQL